MSWLTLGLVGGLVGLDATSFPQAMFSRPIVAATLGGLIFGNAPAGLALGAVLEIMAFVILPFGATRYPESGTAAAAAGAAYGSTAVTALEPSLLLLALAFALIWEQIAGATVIGLRRYNERAVAPLPNQSNAADLVTRRHISALALDYLRALLVVLAGAALCTIMLRSTADFFALSDQWSSRVITVALLAMLGATLPLFGGLRQKSIAYGIGILTGFLLAR